MEKAKSKYSSVWKHVKIALIVLSILLAGVLILFFIIFGIIFFGGGIGDEEEGIDLIKTTAEYRTLVDTYGAKHVSVKAVNLHEVEETTFLKKIDNGFLEQPGCIIYMEAKNEEGYVYQLDEEFNILYRISLSTFKKGSFNVDPQTMEEFYNSLT